MPLAIYSNFHDGQDDILADDNFSEHAKGKEVYCFQLYLSGSFIKKDTGFTDNNLVLLVV
jgi:hypothetical protein